MDRRDFLCKAVPVTALPFFIGGFSLRAYGRAPFLETLVGTANATDRVLVLIQLNGGNDGLNMVIPLDQYSALMNARSNIAIPEDKVLPLTSVTGLHPAMDGLHQLYQSDRLAVVQSVGYPNPNFSHFRATDIWLTGADSDQELNTGWLGRYLDQEYPDYPIGYPSPVDPDPLAIQVGSVVSPGLQGPSVPMGMAITSTTSFYQLISGNVDTAPDTPAGHELTYLREVLQETQQYASTIKAAAAKAKNLSTQYPAPGKNSLADQLKIVAQLVAGGLKTRIYVVNIGGFDTHSAQVDATAGTDVGQHATLLGKLSVAISAFMDDLQLLNVQDRVIGMTFSEFGRRIKSNASLGTDHGTAAPLLLFGTGITGGVHGSNPVLPSNATVNDNLTMQYDFRSVYASVLSEWFSVPAPELEAVLLKNYQTLPLLRLTEAGGTAPARFQLYQNYPNPFNPTTRIRFHSGGGLVRLKVYDFLGQEVQTLASGSYPEGDHEIVFDASALPSGIYFCRMTIPGGLTETRKMVLAK